MAITAFTLKLEAQRRCPCCGRERSKLGASIPNVRTTTSFECSAIFVETDDAIENYKPCPGGSKLAAKLLTIEAQGKLEQ